MKRFYFAIIIIALFTSCDKKLYYQIYNTSSSSVQMHNNSMKYEDETCLIIYDFWVEGGNAGFKFTNKTDKNIYIDLGSCFFIKNGIAHNYYLNRVSTETSSTNRNNSLTTISDTRIPYTTTLANNVIGKIETSKESYSTANTISFSEEKIICIPPYASKFINEYNINNILYRDCNFLLYPQKNDKSHLSFTKDNSPISFRNYITFCIGKDGDKKYITNDFFIDEITNISEKQACIEEEVTDCNGIKHNNKYMKGKAPNKFYIKYYKSMTEPDNIKY